MTLPLKIKATGRVVLTPELRAFIAEKLGKIEKLIGSAEKAALVEVEVESGTKSRDGGPFRAEVNLTISKKLLRAEARRSSLHEAVDEAILELRRELRRLMTKRRDTARRDARRYRSREKSA